MWRTTVGLCPSPRPPSLPLPMFISPSVCPPCPPCLKSVYCEDPDGECWTLLVFSGHFVSVAEVEGTSGVETMTAEEAAGAKEEEVNTSIYACKLDMWFIFILWMSDDRANTLHSYKKKKEVASETLHQELYRVQRRVLTEVPELRHSICICSKIEVLINFSSNKMLTLHHE